MRSTSSTESHFRPLNCCWSISRRCSSSFLTPVLLSTISGSDRPPLLPPGREDDDPCATVTNSNLARISLLILSLPMLPGGLLLPLPLLTGGSRVGPRTGLMLRSRLDEDDLFCDTAGAVVGSLSSSPFESSSISNESHSTPS